MKITVFGATGRTGQHIVRQALAAGHQVIAFARPPSKLPIQHERLAVIQGDVQDRTQVEKAVAGADAVISVLAPTPTNPPFQVSRGTEHILAAMQKHGVRRLVISAGAGVGDPNDAPKLIHKLINTLIKLTARPVYEDIKRTVDIVRASDRDWVIVRAPRLVDSPATGRVKVGYVGKGMGFTLTRGDLADFMLKQVQDDTYLHKAPAISN